MSAQSSTFAFLIVVPVAAAVIGFLLGRLIRGRPPRIEIERPRIAISTAYLRDAHNAALSPHTRTRCAYDAAYFCLFEVAKGRDLDAACKEHPCAEVIEAGLTAIGAPKEDCDAVKLLADWAASGNPLLPNIAVGDACKLAARIHATTVSVLS